MTFNNAQTIAKLEIMQKRIKTMYAFINLLDKYNNIDLDYLSILHKNIEKTQRECRELIYLLK